MPSKSKKQYKYIRYLRGKYKSKDKAPKKDQWAFKPEWTKGVKYSKLPEAEVTNKKMQRYIPLSEKTGFGHTVVTATPEQKTKEFKTQKIMDIITKLRMKRKGKEAQPQGAEEQPPETEIG